MRPERQCTHCQTTEAEWWWYCPRHKRWECDDCSLDSRLLYDGDGTHRFGCPTAYGVVIEAGKEVQWTH
jgi:hypothetical protein